MTSMLGAAPAHGSAYQILGRYLLGISRTITMNLERVSDVLNAWPRKTYGKDGTYAGSGIQKNVRKHLGSSCDP